MNEERLQSLRGAGWLLAASALLAGVLMHNHPHGGDAARMIRSVHGGLLLLLALQPAILGLVARALGWRLETALALGFFTLGTIGAVLAGTINGFVVPALGEYPAGEIGPGILELAWQLNQALATLGAIAAGLGIALFGVALWSEGWRWIGGAGLLAGIVPAALLLAGITDMRFYGAILTYIMQLLWMVMLGIGLVRAGRAVTLPSID